MVLHQKHIRLENVNVYCEYSITKKPPLLLIHGVAATTYTFHALMPLLEDHFSIVALDLPGFGKSEKPSSFKYSYENYARIIAGCIKYFQLKNVNIVGHSMGGQVALYTAKMIPEKIHSLILLASSGYLKRTNRAFIYCTYLPFFNYYVKKQVYKKEVREVLKNVFYNHSLITDDHIREFERPLQEKGFYTALKRLVRYREGDLTSDELHNIQIPTLLLWGKEDRVVPVHVGERLAKDLPNGKLIILEKTGHLLTEERPKEIFHHIFEYVYNVPFGRKE
ncbi:alpha/beta fold hydrolase [Calidifontibacillus erzurumensis]|uniref:Alpha/beta hydrolase n=1 Tax=Calidifontibacillus erzurumensis TaxID=2741433 RepID=A0A8J8GH18_9BACI|nr:alpha/beta hydrolase [Calidifontibacillus erzurumensis]NSL53232.1 alpha/beta hydrolase [Calidifontibacillus erzurumensis]